MTPTLGAAVEYVIEPAVAVAEDHHAPPSAKRCLAAGFPALPTHLPGMVIATL
jgi:hypothetical protein